MQENFGDIFAEYYPMYRGQATNIPVYGEAEYSIGIKLANNSIRKWSRADGMLWRELIQTLQRNAQIGLVKTVTGISITAPTNMRKPPSKVRFYQGSSYTDWTVIDPQDQENQSDLSGYVYFVGGANTGFTMYIGGNGATQFNGWSIDYVYVKSPTLFTSGTTPAAQIPDMSDINFIIQDMLATRFANSQNGFGYKTAKADATTSLANMKIENCSGTFGSVEDAYDGTSWGTPNNDLSGIRMF